MRPAADPGQQADGRQCPSRARSYRSWIGVGQTTGGARSTQGVAAGRCVNRGSSLNHPCRSASHRIPLRICPAGTPANIEFGSLDRPVTTDPAATTQPSANRGAFQKRRTSSDPDVIPDSDFAVRIQRRTVFIHHCVPVAVHDENIPGDQDVITDHY